MSEKANSIPAVTYAPRPPRLRVPPFWMISFALISVVGSWIPLVLFARARVVESPDPRVHFVQDMGTQPKYKEQQSSSLFADGRADRLPIPGTVARGHLETDDHLYRGYSKVDGKINFFDAFPEQVKVNDALLARGQNRFNIYCSVCHGLDGHGHGSVAQRAEELAKLGTAGMSWTQPADIPVIAPTRTVGHLYNTVNVGIRNMAGYGSQISTKDRWAIVAYIRALQVSANGAGSLAAAPGTSK